jgi:hypothetical protein
LRSDDLTLFAIIGVVALPVFAVSARVMLRAGADALLRVRQASPPATAIEPPGKVAALQREVEELRAQIDRMSATESFYAQLQERASPTP